MNLAGSSFPALDLALPDGRGNGSLLSRDGRSAQATQDMCRRSAPDKGWRRPCPLRGAERNRVRWPNRAREERLASRQSRIEVVVQFTRHHGGMPVTRRLLLPPLMT